MIEKTYFGTTKTGFSSSLYTISNHNGMKVSVTDFGAILVSVLLPDGRDVVLGFDSVEGYETNPSFFGGTIGRNSNRTKGASFVINGTLYQMPVNENGNNLHSHAELGFHKKIWTEQAVNESSVTFCLTSPDGELGFPGNLTCSVTYELTEENGIRITYRGISDQDTVFNPTNHSYFNLKGHNGGSILDHVLTVDADAFTELEADMVPNGTIIPVEGTPLDFRTAKRVGEDIDADNNYLHMAGGYDQNWCLKERAEGVPSAVLSEPETGTVMEIYTDRPGIQIYSGNFIDPQTGKGGVFYGKRDGIALETQIWPDAVHHENFPSPLIRAGEAFESVTEYRFR